jgi:hypothetical protein
MEHEERSGDQTAKRYKVIPVQTLPKVEDAEHSKHREGNDLLNHLELIGREGPGANPIGWHLKAVLEKCDRPAGQYHLPKRYLFELQMTIPGEGHKDV